MSFTAKSHLTNEIDQTLSSSLSEEQARLYYLHQIDPSNPEIYMGIRVNINGPLNLGMLQNSLDRVTDRHHLLRSVFPEVDGSPVIKLCDNFQCRILSTDLSRLTPEKQTSQLGEMLKTFTVPSPAFSIESGPLIKAQIVKLNDHDYVLAIQMHHLICDAWSIRLVVKELMSEYQMAIENTTSDQEETHQYDKFVNWEHQKKNAENKKEIESYWSKKLLNPQVFDFPIDQERPEVHTGNSASTKFTIPKDLAKQITDACKARGATPYMYLFTAFNIFLHKISSQTDILIGAPAASRGEPEFENMMGPLIDWLVLRNMVNPESTFDQFFKEVSKGTIETYQHQGPSFSKLMSLADGVKRDPSRNPLFQIFFNYITSPAIEAPDGLKIENSLFEWTKSHFDLALFIEPKDGAFNLTITYYKDIFKSATIQDFSTTYLDIIKHYLTSGAEKISLFKTPYLDQVTENREKEKSKDADKIFAIASTFTTDPISESLEYWNKKLRLNFQIEHGGLNQVFQNLMDPTGIFSRNRTGLNVILLRFSDWKDPEKNLIEFIELFKIRAEKSLAHTLIFTCPPNQVSKKNFVTSDLHNKLTALIQSELSNINQASVITFEEVLKRYPVSDIFDNDSDEYAVIPYTPDYYVAMATVIARKTQLLKRPPPKVLVLDCDNTIWKGVVGEDGIEGIEIGPVGKYIQKFAVNQMDSGMLICLSSKNNEADVWEVFEKRGDMELRRDQIVASRINWEPKSKNIASMAQELNLGIDSFVFIDDSATECAEVSTNCPGVFVIQVPTTEDQIEKIFDNLWIFDERKVTDTDRKRTKMYIENSQREQLKKGTSGINDFVASLAVKLTFHTIDSENIARASQMTQRTNQFNATTIRRSESDLLSITKEPNTESLLIEVSDRFGDYGIVGLVIFKTTTSKVVVDTFLLSCRALGRGVEQKILKRLGEVAKTHAATEIEIPLIVSAKNRPIRQFLDGTAEKFRKTNKEDTSYSYNIPVEMALSAGDMAMAIEFVEEDKKQVHTLTAPVVAHKVWIEIAHSMNTIEGITRQINSSVIRSRATDAGDFEAPRNESELAVTEIWKQTLAVDVVGINDNYFSLGGDSIRSLQIVSKMKKLGFSLKPLDIQQFPTIKKLMENIAAIKGQKLPKKINSIDDGGHFKWDGKPYPLSFTQEAMIQDYIAANSTNGKARSGAYHNQKVFDFKDRSGNASVESLKEALEILTSSQITLQTYISPNGTDGTLVQIVRPDHKIVPKFTNVSHLSSKEQNLFVINLMKQDSENLFDPFNQHGDLARWHIIQKSTDTITLCGSSHHAFVDGWGFFEYMKSLFELYFAIKGKDVKYLQQFNLNLTAAAESKKNVYYEFVSLEQKDLKLKTHSEFWTRYMKEDYLLTSAMKFKSRQPAVYEETRLMFNIDISTIQTAEKVSKHFGVSLRSVFMSPVMDVMAKETNTAHPILAVVTNGRTDELSDPLLSYGLYFRFLPIVGTIDSDKVTQLKIVHDDLVNIEIHSRYPLKNIFKGRNQNDFVSASFILVQFHNVQWSASDRKFDLNEVKTVDKFHYPINFKIDLAGDNSNGSLVINWDANFFSSERVEAVAKDYLVSLKNHINKCLLGVKKLDKAA